MAAPVVKAVHDMQRIMPRFVDCTPQAEIVEASAGTRNPFTAVGDRYLPAMRYAALGEQARTPKKPARRLAAGFEGAEPAP